MSQNPGDRSVRDSQRLRTTPGCRTRAAAPRRGCAALALARGRDAATERANDFLLAEIA